MLKFVKSLWIAMLAAAATFTSCVRLDAGHGAASKAAPPAPAVVKAPATR